jgi:hypothetical protein
VWQALPVPLQTTEFTEATVEICPLGATTSVLPISSVVAQHGARGVPLDAQALMSSALHFLSYSRQQQREKNDMSLTHTYLEMGAASCEHGLRR